MTMGTHKIAILDTERRDAIRRVDADDRVPGELQKGHVGVFNKRGERVGHLHGNGGGASAASRLLGGRSAVLKNGAWVERGDDVAAQQYGALNKEVHEASLRAAKGSVGAPRAPKTSARPKHGG
jgi:hypothetical protein